MTQKNTFITYLKSVIKRITYQNFKANVKFTWPIFLFGSLPLLIIFLFLCYQGYYSYFDQLSSNILYSIDLKVKIKDATRFIITDELKSLLENLTYFIIIYVIVNLIKDSNKNNKVIRKLYIYQSALLSLAFSSVCLMTCSTFYLNLSAYYLGTEINSNVEIRCLLNSSCSKLLTEQYNKGLSAYSKNKNLILSNYYLIEKNCNKTKKGRVELAACINKAESEQ